MIVTKRVLQNADAIVSLLHTVKSATSLEIRDKLNISKDECNYILSILRRTHPNVSAVRGHYYVWLDTPDVNDTGMCPDVEYRVSMVHDYIMNVRSTTSQEIADYLGLSRSTVVNYIRTIQRWDKNVIVSKDIAGIKYEESRNDVLYGKVCSVLNDSEPKPVKTVAEELHVSESTVCRYLAKLCNTKRIMRTREGSCMLPIDAPVDKMTDVMVIAYTYLVEHGTLNTRGLMELRKMSKNNAVRYLRQLALLIDDIELKIVDRRLTLVYSK